MALIDCEECNARISTKAVACPHCGAPVPRPAPPPPPPPKAPEPEEPEKSVTFLDCFLQSFARPRATIRRILKQKPGYAVSPLIWFCSLLGALHPRYFLGFKWMIGDLRASIAAAVLFMTVFYVLVNWLGIWGDYLVGKLFGGKASLKEVSTAYIWAFGPFFLGALISLAGDLPQWMLILKGGISHLYFGEYYNPLFRLGSLALGAASLGFYAWCFVWTVFNIAETQKFKLGPAFATVLLASIPQVLVTYVVSLIITFLSYAR